MVWSYSDSLMVFFLDGLFLAGLSPRTHASKIRMVEGIRNLTVTFPRYFRPLEHNA